MVLLADLSAYCQSVENFNNDLTGWWRGEDNARDSHSNHHGRVEGPVGYTAGKVGRAFSFVNTGTAPYSSVLLDNRVQNPFLPSLSGTVALWVEWDPRAPASQKNGGGIFGGKSGTSIAPTLVVNNYRLGWAFGGREDSNPVLSDNLQRCFGWYFLPKSVANQPDQWHHVALTYARSNGPNYRVVFYVNGRKVGSDCGADMQFYQPVSDIAIGKVPGLAVYGWSGLIDEVRTYSRALTEAEVEAIYKFER